MILAFRFHSIPWNGMEPWLRWNRRTTERLREGQEPWPSRHGLNRERVYFFLTSIRHPTELRLWNGIYVLRLFIWSSVSFVFFFFWCYYRSRVYSRELFLLTQLFSLHSLLKVFEQQMWFWFLQGVVFKLMQEQEKYIMMQESEIIKVYWIINSDILHR